jgi:translocator protein
MNTRSTVGLLVWIAICFAAAGLGSWATAAQIDTWYATLSKPSFNPPNWVFGPVWSLLFLLMAISAWQIWLPNGIAGARWELTIFAVQLVLNVLWSVLFFGCQMMLAALVEIVLLWLAILAMIILFARRKRWVGFLQVPYLCWVSFATVLNAALWWLNRG